ncbi:class I SAM-dependent methyltransferase [Candidatus Methylocalor cossyra]|uniref:SAM-dependent methyltransferase n=1 Tax=Candidatus Methylocalor cossyra TaxID=3108543 RepID=A0ABM9NF00_9GAMM
MLHKLFIRIAYIPELYRKYKILREHCLLDDRISSRELKEYLFACACMGRHHGYLRALREGMCVDAAGNPIPWYTYPAIEQLSKWDFSESEVFEYGCGNSTRWWAERAKRVVSVESSREWYNKILESSTLPDNVQPILSPFEEGDGEAARRAYIDAINAFAEFDIIVIDGVTADKTRLDCARAALNHLKKGGMIILDNADWHPQTSRLLREAGLLEIDYCGNGPLNTYTETTSLFLSEGFRVSPRNDIHPGYAIGGLQVQIG